MAIAMPAEMATTSRIAGPNRSFAIPNISETFALQGEHVAGNPDLGSVDSSISPLGDQLRFVLGIRAIRRDFITFEQIADARDHPQVEQLRFAQLGEGVVETGLFFWQKIRPGQFCRLRIKGEGERKLDGDPWFHDWIMWTSR